MRDSPLRQAWVSLLKIAISPKAIPLLTKYKIIASVHQSQHECNRKLWRIPILARCAKPVGLATMPVLAGDEDKLAGLRRDLLLHRRLGRLPYKYSLY